MENRKTPKFVFIALLAQFFLLLVILPTNIIQNTITHETRSAERWLGVSGGLWVSDNASAMQSRLVDDTGLRELFQSAVDRPEQTIGVEEEKLPAMDRLAETVLPYLSARMDVLFAIIFLVLLRVMLIAVWWPYLSVWILCSYLDGHLQRKAYKNSWKHASHVFHGLVLKASKIFALLVFVLIFVPFNVPVVIYPLIGVCVGLLLSMSVSHLQKTL